MNGQGDNTGDSPLQKISTSFQNVNMDGWNKKEKNKFKRAEKDCISYASDVSTNFEGVLEPAALVSIATDFSVQDDQDFRSIRDRLSLRLGILEFLKYEIEDSIKKIIESAAMSGRFTKDWVQNLRGRVVTATKGVFIIRGQKEQEANAVKKDVEECVQALFDEATVQALTESVNDDNVKENEKEILKVIFQRIQGNVLQNFADIFDRVAEGVFTTTIQKAEGAAASFLLHRRKPCQSTRSGRVRVWPTTTSNTVTGRR